MSILATLTFLFFLYFRKLTASSLPDSELPFVTVIVPARNEESKIGRCIESLALQNYPNYEVIAVNDRSDDRTGEIIQALADKYPQIKCVHAKEAPPGWLGKCSALVQAVEHANGQWFLFTDADTCHSADSLRYSLSYAVKNKAELISFMPVQELGSFWERTVMPVLLGSFLCGDPLNTINEHTNERAYAYGQYILVRRDVYENVGGHEAVHDQILDDISLARVAKSKGYHILSADGRLLYKVRMYTDLQSLWQGWTKNLYALIECNLFYLLTVIFLVNIAIVGPFISAAIVLSMFLHGDRGTELTILSSQLVCQFALLYSWYRRCRQHYLGVDWRDFFLLPLGSLTMTLLYLHSAYLVHSGVKVSWKGRKYTVNTSKSIEDVFSAKNNLSNKQALEQVTALAADGELVK
ncbi:MAG: glycosyltransferase [Candidatus Obscuribacterales bacterium]|nr:glycosyltransferase [Candidatus Obscuribacterales bacterium]